MLTPPPEMVPIIERGAVLLMVLRMAVVDSETCEMSDEELNFLERHGFLNGGFTHFYRRSDS